MVTLSEVLACDWLIPLCLNVHQTDFVFPPKTLSICHIMDYAD